MWISLWTRILDFVAPRHCTCCGVRLSVTEDVLCVSCLAHLPRTRYWLSPLDNRVARLFWGRFPVERAASYFFYYPHNAFVYPILQMKYRSRPWIAVALGRYMAAELAPSGFFDGVDVLVPVPLTWRRQLKRGYNQSERIARGVSEITGIRVAPKALMRTRFAQSQTKRTSYERREGMDGLFRLAQAGQVEGRHVMLIDDVITTGSTVCAAAEALLEARGITVSVLSVCCTQRSGVRH